MRILLVEDHVETLRAFRWLLTKHGHQVTTTGTLAEARAACDAGGLDLMFCDLGLPDGDGRELAELARHCGIAAVAVTGLDRVAAGSRADGFWAFLTKPVSFGQVKEILSAAEAMLKSTTPAWRAAGSGQRDPQELPAGQHEQAAAVGMDQELLRRRVGG